MDKEIIVPQTDEMVQIRWKSLFELIRGDAVAEIQSIKGTSKELDTLYLEKLHESLNRYNKYVTNIRYYYLALLFLTYFATNRGDSEFTALLINIKNASHFRGPLFFVISILGILYLYYNIVQDYIKFRIESYIKAKYSDGVEVLLGHVYLDKFSYYQGDHKNQIPHPVAAIPLLTLVATVAILPILYFLIIVSVQYFILNDIINNPFSNNIEHYIIIATALSAILAQFCNLVIRMPFPVRDYTKLYYEQNINSEEYNNYLTSQVEKSLKREKTYDIIICAIIYGCVIKICLQIMWDIPILLHSNFLITTAPINVILIIISQLLYKKKIKKPILINFFSKEFTTKDDKLREFNKIQTLSKLLKYLTITLTAFINYTILYIISIFI